MGWEEKKGCEAEEDAKGGREESSACVRGGRRRVLRDATHPREPGEARELLSRSSSFPAHIRRRSVPAPPAPPKSTQSRHADGAMATVERLLRLWDAECVLC